MLQIQKKILDFITNTYSIEESSFYFYIVGGIIAFLLGLIFVLLANLVYSFLYCLRNKIKTKPNK